MRGLPSELFYRIEVPEVMSILLEKWRDNQGIEKANEECQQMFSKWTRWNFPFIHSFNLQLDNAELLAHFGQLKLNEILSIFLSIQTSINFFSIFSLLLRINSDIGIF